MSPHPTTDAPASPAERLGQNPLAEHDKPVIPASSGVSASPAASPVVSPLLTCEEAARYLRRSPSWLMRVRDMPVPIIQSFGITACYLPTGFDKQWGKKSHPNILIDTWFLQSCLPQLLAFHRPLAHMRAPVAARASPLFPTAWASTEETSKARQASLWRTPPTPIGRFCWRASNEG